MSYDDPFADPPDRKPGGWCPLLGLALAGAPVVLLCALVNLALRVW